MRKAAAAFSPFAHSNMKIRTILMLGWLLGLIVANGQEAAPPATAPAPPSAAQHVLAPSRAGEVEAPPPPVPSTTPRGACALVPLLFLPRAKSVQRRGLALKSGAGAEFSLHHHLAPLLFPACEKRSKRRFAPKSGAGVDAPLELFEGDVGGGVSTSIGQTGPARVGRTAAGREPEKRESVFPRLRQCRARSRGTLARRKAPASVTTTHLAATD